MRGKGREEWDKVDFQAVWAGCVCAYMFIHMQKKTGTLIISLVISMIVLDNFRSILIAFIPKVRKRYLCFTRPHEIKLEMHLNLIFCPSVLFSHQYLLSLRLRVMRTVLETKSQIAKHLVQRIKFGTLILGWFFFFTISLFTNINGAHHTISEVSRKPKYRKENQFHSHTASQG